jgi:CRP/FNR family transcriptional regulator, cyclic AMP receptor protein
MSHLAQTAGEPRSGGFTGTLEASEREALLRLGHERRYPPRATLLLLGSRTDTVLVLLDGWAKVAGSTVDGREVLFTVIGPGDLSGHWEAATGAACAANVTTLGACRVRTMSTTVFLGFLEAHPQVTLALLRHTIAGFQIADRRRMEAGTRDAAHRLGSVVREHATVYGGSGDGGETVEIGIPLAQDEIAGLISASRQSVARALTSLRGLGLIETGRRSITVCDLPGLHRFVDQR